MHKRGARITCKLMRTDMLESVNENEILHVSSGAEVDGKGTQANNGSLNQNSTVGQLWFNGLGSKITILSECELSRNWREGQQLD